MSASLTKSPKVKELDLGGIDFNAVNTQATIDYVYKAFASDFGYPIYLKNFKINQEYHDAEIIKPILVNNAYVGYLTDFTLHVSEDGIEADSGLRIYSDIYAEEKLAPLGNIQDAMGRDRFLEGNLNVSTALASGINITYRKWSLSGTHLMFVVAGTMASTTTITTDTRELCYLTNSNIPQWIIDKIVNTIGTRVETKDVNFYSNIYSSTTYKIALVKGTSNLSILFSEAYPQAGSDMSFRITFDLLIDTEA